MTDLSKRHPGEPFGGDRGNHHTSACQVPSGGARKPPSMNPGDPRIRRGNRERHDRQPTASTAMGEKVTCDRWWVGGGSVVGRCWVGVGRWEVDDGAGVGRWWVGGGSVVGRWWVGAAIIHL